MERDNARVLETILRRAGIGLSETRLLKLTYMTDLFAWQVLGRPISSFEYIRYQQAPFDPEFYRAKDSLLRDGRATGREITTRQGYDCTLLEASGQEDGNTGDFSTAELHLIDGVLSKYKRTALSRLLKHVVYRTEPMLRARHGDRLPMEKEKNKLRDAKGGVSLEKILESRRKVAEGDTISFDEFKERLRV